MKSKGFTWTPILILSPVLIVLVLTYILLNWNPYGILAIGVFLIEILFITLIDRILTYLMKHKNVWIIEIVFISVVISLKLYYHISLWDIIFSIF